MAFCALSIYGDAVDAVVGTLLTLPSQVSKLCSYVRVLPAVQCDTHVLLGRQLESLDTNGTGKLLEPWFRYRPERHLYSLPNLAPYIRTFGVVSTYC